MDRRTFVQAVTASGISLGLPAGVRTCWSAERAEQRFLLSEQGSGRATGYAESSKIITLGGKTHVCWLDSAPEGFRVRIRTLDRSTGQWSPTYAVGEAYDNHGGPALTVDSDGFLHIVYYPHHHPMRYRKSQRPNDASLWEEEIQFGQQCTYPTLVCGADDTLYFLCRRRFVDKPWEVELWTKKPGESWTGPRAILRSRFTGYAHFQPSLAWSPDRHVLHLSCRFHERSDKAAYGRLQTVGYLASHDFGRSWQKADGSTVETPATAESIDVIEGGGLDKNRVLRAGSIAVDLSGTPHTMRSVQGDQSAHTKLSTPLTDGTWRAANLDSHLPQRWQAWNMIMTGGVSFNDVGDLFATAQIQQCKREDTWGHPSNEVVRFRSADRGRSFAFDLLSQPDDSISSWLPNIERHTGHNEIPGLAGVIYTAGPPGPGLKDILTNRVYWQG